MQQLKKERILQVFRLQEERAKIHHDFSREFKLFLLHKDEEKYNEIVKEITKKFGEKSLQIRGIISELQESKEDNELQSNLENLQALEKHLLLLTISKQVMKKEMVIDKEDEYEVSDPVHIHSIKLKSKEIQKVITDINELLHYLRYDLFDDDNQE